MRNIFHALGLHMHQPPGNLRLLLDSNPWEAQQILHAYERPARYALLYKGVARFHVGFSGILLEQLQDPENIERCRAYMDLPAMLAAYRAADNIEILGMGYYHPLFPLTPEADWDEQLARGREMVIRTFGRAPKGFWPSEMAFSMEMIPALVKAGYEYVVVDHVHVRPEGGEPLEPYRPYRACHGGSCITVVPRDRDLSNAQESGLDSAWFANEIRQKTAHSPHPEAPRLVTTWSDGENGGWFRNMDENASFFGHYFAPYMEHVRAGEYPAQPIALSDFLAAYPARDEAEVVTGAWNVGNTSGVDFRQWAGSEEQRQALATLHALSAAWHQADGRRGTLSPKDRQRLSQARELILEAETSCYLFWGNVWLPGLYERLDAATALLPRSPEPAGTTNVATARPAPDVEPAVRSAGTAGVTPPAAPKTKGTKAGRDPASPSSGKARNRRSPKSG